MVEVDKAGWVDSWVAWMFIVKISKIEWKTYRLSAKKKLVDKSTITDYKGEGLQAINSNQNYSKLWKTDWIW